MIRTRLLVLLMAAALAPAQDYRARIQGRVTDASQAIIVGAKVTLTNVRQGIDTVRETGPGGTYVFDFVDPGNYAISFEASGFRKFVQQNILVQTRGDVTVDAELQVGAAAQTVEVTEAPVTLQFNTASRDLTIDNKMVRELPLITRNPFKLATLDPSIVNTSGGEQSPYHHWTAQEVDTGGNTSRRNDILIDGTPVETGPKTAYTPSMDAVTEFTIQQNSVDAEFGHSAGGILSVAMKSGTNEYHGTAYYLGRNPAFNALSDRTITPPTKNKVRNHVFGGTIGNPVVRNKLFNFFSYEAWRTVEPVNFTRTMPTAAERGGDFSASLNTRSALRQIFDPLTTRFDPARNTSSRTPFAGNVIPRARFDPLAARLMDQVWLPNSPGIDATGRNNFMVDAARSFSYWNLSDRADWHISDKWKVFGRYSQFHTVVSENNLSGNDSQWWPYDAGSLRHGLNVAGDAVYTQSATTVWNVRGSWNAIIDQYDGGPFVTNEDALAKLWSSKWFSPYLKEVPQILPPRFDIDGSGAFAKGNYWFQRPKSMSLHGRMSHYRGSHYLKTGLEQRQLLGRSTRPDPMRFTFRKTLTADTFIAPNTSLVGDGWASFLIGALDDTSYARSVPMQRARYGYWSAYVQDDFKLNKAVTLNLGLRWEYESAPYDPDNRVPRYLDLKDAIPEMKANPPVIPADAAALMPAPYQFNGAWYFADSNDRQMWNSPKATFLPRAGVAIRLNDRTAIRAGFARYGVPPMLMATGGVGDTLGSMYLPGFNAETYTLPVLEGIPTGKFADPFPASNPLIMPVEKRVGRYTGIGSDLRWSYQDARMGINDRINLSFQRELVDQIVVDVTWFTNFGRDMTYTRNLNLMNPKLSYTQKAELSRRVANPFYRYLTPDKFPGQLRNLQFLTKGDLLRPYPHYTGLREENTPGPRNRYNALQLRVQRPFARGWNLLAAYNYNRERNEAFFNSDAEYANEFAWHTATRPRHRLTGAGVFELPFGKGRPYLPQLHPVVEGVIGGWQLSSMITVQSGDMLSFGQMEISGDPRLDNPTPQRWFKTEMFARALPYTPRLNPKYYDGLMGPKQFAWDGTVSKLFPVTERYKLELRLEMYNVLNNLIRENPNTNVLDSQFGRSVRPRAFTFGRQIQYSLRLQF